MSEPTAPKTLGELPVPPHPKDKRPDEVEAAVKLAEGVDRTTLGQRRINLIWEITQAIVTVGITVAEIYCSIKAIEAKVLEFAFIAVISTYYTRTNHTKIGGVKPEEVGR